MTPEELRAAVRVDCDNVAQYVAETLKEDPHVFRWRPEEIPNAAPPFSLMWMDWRDRIFADRNPHNGRWGGVLIKSHRAEDGGWVVDTEGCWLFGGTVANCACLHFTVLPNGAVDVASVTEERINYVSPSDIAAYREDPLYRTTPEYRSAVDTLAAMSTNPRGLSSSWLWMLPAFLAISFMHCKNVGMEPSPVSQFENRAWKAKHRFPLLRYERVVIEPMRKVLHREGGVGEHGLRKALHICRGHFATYTEERPLFGRVTGTFWKAQHLRGTAESGAVVKDYSVLPPRHR